jgi:mono/diheme cytochrome c family protein
MVRNKSYLAFILISLLLQFASSCNPLTEKEIEYRQSFESGKAIYEDECQKCHKANGEGLGTLYPPLANSDYLQSHIDQLPCIIYNGLKGEITVNGKKFNWEMPAHKTMDEIQMSSILTYVRSNWGNNKGTVNYKEARMAIEACKR